MERLRGTAGQATSEYVALIAVVAVVLAAAAGLTSGGVAGRVLAGLQRGLCEVAGAACSRPRPPDADLAPCPVERAERGESLAGALGFARLGGGGTLTAVRGSDGRVIVTLSDDKAVGGEAGLGLSLNAGPLRGVRAQAGLDASVVSGRSWTLPDAAAARAFIARYGSKATIGGKAVDLVRSGCSILCDAIGWRPHAELPPPDERYVGSGLAAHVGASFGLADLEASGGGLLGGRLGRDGSSTWFLQLDSAQGADVVLGGGAIGVGRGRQAVVEYTLDPRHRPTQLVIHTASRADRRGAIGAGDGRPLGSIGTGEGRVVELDATLDLRDPRNRAAAAAFVAALRDPLAIGALRRRAALVHARIARTGVVDRREYALTSSALELGATLALGPQLGGGFARSHAGMRLLRAETRLPGLPFLPRDDCRST